jgi:hypothetical protein
MAQMGGAREQLNALHFAGHTEQQQVDVGRSVAGAVNACLRLPGKSRCSAGFATCCLVCNALIRLSSGTFMIRQGAALNATVPGIVRERDLKCEH